MIDLILKNIRAVALLIQSLEVDSESRRAVIPATIRALLPREKALRDEVWVESHRLYEMGQLLDGTVPFLSYLEHLIALAGELEQAAALAELLRWFTVHGLPARRAGEDVGAPFEHSAH